MLVQIQLVRLLVGSLVRLLVGKSYHTKQKDGYSLPTNDPTNNSIDWIWRSKKIGLMSTITDYLRTPGESFFQKSRILGLGKHVGLKHLGKFRVFLADLSEPIFVLWVPCPCFPVINHYFYKKVSNIPNINLGMGFEFQFGPQRIRDLAVVRP